MLRILSIRDLITNCITSIIATFVKTDVTSSDGTKLFDTFTILDNHKLNCFFGTIYGKLLT